MKPFAVEIVDIETGEVLVRQQFRTKAIAELAAREVFINVVADDSFDPAEVSALHSPENASTGTEVRVVEVA